MDEQNLNTSSQPVTEVSAPVDPVTPSVPETPPPPEVAQEPKRKVSPLVIGMGILLVILLAITGFLGYQNMQLRSEVDGMKVVQMQEAELAMNEPTPAATPDPMADWEEYTINGLSFKYPQKLQETEEVGISGPLSVKAELITHFADLSTVKRNTDAPFDGFAIYEQDTSKIKVSFNEYLNNEVEAIKNGVAFTNPEAKMQTVTLGSNTFSYINSETSITRYFIESPDLKRIIIFSMLNSTDNFKETFEQILSTFEFTQ